MSTRKKTIYEYEREQDPIHDGANTFVQWKGTAVCMDFRCKCSHHMHFDCEFLYFVRCSACKTDFILGSQVKVIEVPPEFAKEVAESGCLWTEAGDNDSIAERVNP